MQAKVRASFARILGPDALPCKLIRIVTIPSTEFKRQRIKLPSRIGMEVAMAAFVVSGTGDEPSPSSRLTRGQRRPFQSSARQDFQKRRRDQYLAHSGPISRPTTLVSTPARQDFRSPSKVSAPRGSYGRGPPRQPATSIRYRTSFRGCTPRALISGRFLFRQQALWMTVAAPPQSCPCRVPSGCAWSRRAVRRAIWRSRGRAPSPG